MQQVYAVLNQHVRYAATKAFFGAEMINGSFVPEHGVMMLFFMEKIKDLQVYLEKETYIDVNLQSLLSWFNPFIANYNLNGFDKVLHELINILVQYKAMVEKYAPVVLVGEASTLKANDKDVGCKKRKNGKTTSTIASTLSVVVVIPQGESKGKKKRI
ncbi:UNVERIFIED_CONTAM: hypothetical protein Sradi_5074400 [Sesamum radiatum]|uniref:Uncharacterized protein n=1 Tax=Sesamum radiatum TaxID=300843 RepID=A0AAW2M1N8_SESRA